MNAFREFLTGDEAATAVEYAVMLGLILVSCLATLRALGDASNGMWGKNNNELQAHGF
jgi:pilus assembly protein Flp/PilA